MTRIEFWSAVMGLLVAIVVMFNQVNGRIDRLQSETNRRFDQVFNRMDRMQAETNTRFDAHQTETNRRFEAVDARFDQMFDRMDRMQEESNRRFDALLETIMSFDRRVSRLEGRLDAQGAEAPAP